MLFDPKWEIPADIKLEPWQEILLKAADILEEKGWGQHGVESAKGYCAIGAMQMACYGQTYFTSTKIKNLTTREQHCRDYKEACFYLTKGLSDTIWSWNDTRGRTKEEVVTKLREAAHVV